MYDMNHLTKIKQMNAAAPGLMSAFRAFDQAAFAEGSLSVLIKELIAVAVGATTQCPYCIEVHSKRAKALGATDAMLTEAAMVAAAIRAGGAMTHATHAL